MLQNTSQWSGKKPTVVHMKSFGCKVYCPIDRKYRAGKLGAVRYEGVLVGYSETSPLVRVWNPLKDKRVLNVGGADYDESVERGWWLESVRYSATYLYIIKDNSLVGQSCHLRLPNNWRVLLC